MKFHIGITGTGFAEAILARELAESGKYRITIFDEHQNLGGLFHTFRDEETGIMIHRWGPRIFHTKSEELWNYMNSWGRFENYNVQVQSNTLNGIFNFPINLLTLNQFFSKKLGPIEAQDFLGSLSESHISVPENLEEKYLKKFGKAIYHNFFYQFLKKWWGTEPRNLSSTIEEDILLRFNYNSCYYDGPYQGVPVSGHTEIIRRILDHQNIEVRLGQSIEENKKRDFDHIFWSGPMDQFFHHQFGKLTYRTFNYERVLDYQDYQGTAIIHFCEEDIPFTRTIEFKHFMPWERHEKTIVYKEYSTNSGEFDVPQLSVRTPLDLQRLRQYQELSQHFERVTFIGPIGTYRNLELEAQISESLNLAKTCQQLELKDWPRFSSQVMARS